MKDITMTEKDGEDVKIIKVCRFCEKNIECDKVRDHCHLTGKYRGPAHSICNTNVTQDQSIIIPFIFHNFTKYDCHLFFKKVVDKKKDKVKFKLIPKTNKEYISVRYGCISFIDSYRFLSSSLDSLVKTLIDNSHKTLKDLKEEIVDNDEKLNFVNEIEEKDRTIKDLKKDCLDESKELEEALLNYMGENDLKLLKTEFLDNKWKYLTKKIAYSFEYFNSIDDYQKPVNNLKKEDFFSKLKIDYPSDEEIERAKENIKRFNIKSGEELTEIYLKSDVLLLKFVFEKFIEVSVNENGINPLYCVSFLAYTWRCGLKYTRINLQTLQDKDWNLTLENKIRGCISSVMRDRYVKSDENKKILYMDATIFYGHSMTQPLPDDEIEMWHGHADLYMNKLEGISDAPDDCVIGYFIEIDLRFPNNIKKQRIFHFVLKINLFIKINIMFMWKQYNLRIIQNLKN